MTFVSMAPVLFLSMSAHAMNYYYSQPQARLDPIAIPNVTLPSPPMDCLTPQEQKERNMKRSKMLNAPNIHTKWIT